MTYQPWGYDPTKKLYDLFQEKFGKVWDNATEKTLVPRFEDTKEFQQGIWLNDAFQNYRVPALTLLAFCEFVDDVFDDVEIRVGFIPQKQYGMKIKIDAPIILDNITSNTKIEDLNKPLDSFVVSNINSYLKHFAIDNWSEPDKVIEEVKKYL